MPPSHNNIQKQHQNYDPLESIDFNTHHIYDDNPFEIRLRWCDKQGYIGIGNRLALYWLYRATAFWLNLTFENDYRCSCAKRRISTGIHFCNLVPFKTIWTQFLPSSSTLSVGKLLENNIQFMIYHLSDINNVQNI